MLRKKKVRVERNLTETTLIMQGKGAEVPRGCPELISRALLDSLFRERLVREASALCPADQDCLL